MDARLSAGGFDSIAVTLSYLSDGVIRLEKYSSNDPAMTLFISDSPDLLRNGGVNKVECSLP